MKFDYAIVGGGIVGASIAYHLQQSSDASIAVYDRQSFASETTYRSMAMLGRTGNEMMTRMKQYGFELYNDFFSEPEANSAFELTGSLGVATTEAGAQHLKESLQEEAEVGLYSSGGLHEPVEYLPGDQIKRTTIVPYLRGEDLAGARYRPNKGFTRPQELAYEFIERLDEEQVTLANNTPVERIRTDGTAVTGLETANRTVDASTVICAAGPWNVQLAKTAGLELPVRHEPAPILRLEPEEPLSYTFPYTHHHESGIYFRGSRNGDVYVGHHDRRTTYEDVTQRDPSTVSDKVDPSFRNEAIDVIDQLYPFLLDADITEEWVGLGSRTPDRWPILGWTKVEGLSIAAFHSQGIQLAAAAGRTIAQQLVEEDPTEYYDAVSISRFEGYTDQRSTTAPSS